MPGRGRQGRDLPGFPDKIVFLTFSDGAKRACVRNPNQDRPDVYFVDYSQESGCPHSTCPICRRSIVIRCAAMRFATRPSMRPRLPYATWSFLPMCTPPPGSTTRTPAPRTPGRPEPRDRHPRAGHGAPTTGAPRTDLPGSTAASASVPEQTDDNGNKVCRGPSDVDTRTPARTARQPGQTHRSQH